MVKYKIILILPWITIYYISEWNWPIVVFKICKCTKRSIKESKRNYILFSYSVFCNCAFWVRRSRWFFSSKILDEYVFYILFGRYNFLLISTANIFKIVCIPKITENFSWCTWLWAIQRIFIYLSERSTYLAFHKVLECSIFWRFAMWTNT